MTGKERKAKRAKRYGPHRGWGSIIMRGLADAFTQEYGNTRSKHTKRKICRRHLETWNRTILPYLSDRQAAVGDESGSLGDSPPRRDESHDRSAGEMREMPPTGFYPVTFAKPKIEYDLEMGDIGYIPGKGDRAPRGALRYIDQAAWMR